MATLLLKATGSMASPLRKGRGCMANIALSTGRGRSVSNIVPSPLGAGLSHISKEFKKELFTPGRELHFSGWRPFIRMCLQDIEGNPANKR